MQTIYLAGGCFWCTEAVFKSIRGVESVIPGYIGGTVPNPSYEAVCAGTTGHAKAVQVNFDSSILALGDLLEIFFATHVPTTLNRQGNDVGTQYRSAIFYTTPEQERISHLAIVEAQKNYNDPIVTEVVPATEFYEADESHREYYFKHSNNSYCTIVISPKLDKLQKQFSDKIV
jgi:peptide-methionine (S)-S-oxide reductase